MTIFYILNIKDDRQELRRLWDLLTEFQSLGPEKTNSHSWTLTSTVHSSMHGHGPMIVDTRQMRVIENYAQKM